MLIFIYFVSRNRICCLIMPKKLYVEQDQCQRFVSFAIAEKIFFLFPAATQTLVFHRPFPHSLNIKSSNSFFCSKWGSGSPALKSLSDFTRFKQSDNFGHLKDKMSQIWAPLHVGAALYLLQGLFILMPYLGLGVNLRNKSSGCFNFFCTCAVIVKRYWSAWARCLSDETKWKDSRQEHMQDLTAINGHSD